MTATAQRPRYHRPWLYPKQAAFLFAPERYSITEASTKTGKTVGCMVWLFERALRGKDGQNFWWVAPTIGVAKIAFRRMKRAIPRALYKANETELTVTLRHGPTIWFKGADKPDSLYGEDVYAAVIDEATRCKEESWHAVRSTLTATEGPVRIIGNVKGRKNWAYRLARQAESGSPGMAYFKLTAWDAVAAGILREREVLDAKEVLPEDVFRELYLAEPSDDGGNPFGLAHIRACIQPAGFTTGPAFCWGWDLAKSNDWTAGIPLDRRKNTVRLERWRGPWELTIAKIKTATGGLPALVDSTGVGDPVLEALQKNGGRNFQGWKFTQPNKQQLMEGLAVAIQQHSVSFPDGPIVQELETFEYEYTRTGVHYCLAPETRVVTADLRWVPVGSLGMGDKLLAFDEYPPAGRRRRWRSAVVTQTSRVTRPSYEINFDDGSTVVASQEHLWLVDTGNGAQEWKRTDQLRAPHPTSRSLRYAPTRVIKLLDVWNEERSYEAGYLAAAFDGEGSITQRPRPWPRRGHTFRMSFAQRENAMAKRVREYLTAANFGWAESKGASSALTFGVVGRQAETLRLLGRVRPTRLLAKFDIDKLGAAWGLSTVRVARLTFLGEREVVALGTSTKTLIAEGLASHNTAPEGLHDDTVIALGLAVERAGRGASRLQMPSTASHTG